MDTEKRASIELDQLVAYVIYKQPSFEDLKKQFACDVDPNLEDRQFVPIAGCKNVSQVSRELIFELIEFDWDVTTEEVIEELTADGLRPALYEEFVCFLEKWGRALVNGLLRQGIVELGSETSVAGESNAVVFSQDKHSDKLSLSLTFTGSIPWYDNMLFLAVRE